MDSSTIYRTACDRFCKNMVQYENKQWATTQAVRTFLSINALPKITDEKGKSSGPFGVNNVRTNIYSIPAIIELLNKRCESKTGNLNFYKFAKQYFIDMIHDDVIDDIKDYQEEESDDETKLSPQSKSPQLLSPIPSPRLKTVSTLEFIKQAYDGCTIIENATLGNYTIDLWFQFDQLYVLRHDNPGLKFIREITPSTIQILRLPDKIDHRMAKVIKTINKTLFDGCFQN